MKNNKILLTSDWHIRSDKPEYRKDDFCETQYNKIKFILSVASDYKCPIIIAGDIGHKAYWDNSLLIKYIDLFKQYKLPIFIVAGQHDLPYHNYRKIKESGIGVLMSAGVVSELDLDSTYGQFYIAGFPYGFNIKRPVNFYTQGKRKVAVIHKLISKVVLYGGQTWSQQILRENPRYDLIVSGDNHDSFTDIYQGRLLLNPGSIVRMSTDEELYKPKVYLWNGAKLETIFIPIKQDVFDMSKKIFNTELDESTKEYINTLRKVSISKVSFKKLLEKFIRENKINQKVQDKIWKAVESDKS